MFRYAVKARSNQYNRPQLIALTSFRDVADHMLEFTAQVLDPDGSRGVEVYLVEHPEADRFIKPERAEED